MEDIEFRKIIKFGINSYVVSLPKNWMSRHNLNKGDLVYYLEQGEDLILTPKDHNLKAAKSIILNIDNKDLNRIKLEIISAYLKNYTIIEIRGKKALEQNLLDIRQILHELTGLEVIEQTANKIVAKDLIDLREVSIDATIRRMDMILRAMFDDAIQCLHSFNPENLKHRDKDINRLSYLSFRLLNYAQHNPYFLKSIGIEDTYILARWVIVMRIEELGDQVKRISRFFKTVKLDTTQKDELKKLYARIKPLYEGAMKSFYTKDLQLAITNEFQAKNTRPLITELLRNTPHPTEDLIRIFEFMKMMTSSISHISREVIRKE